MGNEVSAALLEQLKILACIHVIQRNARLHRGTATMHLQCANRGHYHYRIRIQTREATLKIPELLKPNVSTKPALCNDIVTESRGDLVGDYRALTDSNIGKRAGMHKHRLAADRLQQVRIDGINHPGGHSAINFEILCRDVVALLVVGHNDLAHAFAQILQIIRDCEDRHDFTGDRDRKPRVHLEAVHLAALANTDVPQRLRAEIHDPLHLNAFGINV